MTDDLAYPDLTFTGQEGTTELSQLETNMQNTGRRNYNLQ